MDLGYRVSFLDTVAFFLVFQVLKYSRIKQLSIHPFARPPLVVSFFHRRLAFESWLVGFLYLFRSPAILVQKDHRTDVRDPKPDGETCSEGY